MGEKFDKLRDLNHRQISDISGASGIMTTINVVLVGDRGVGKSSLILRLNTGDWNPQYRPTPVPMEYKCTFHTTAGVVTINILDYPDIKNLPSKEQREINAALIMFDVTSKSSYTNVACYHKAIQQQYGNALPILLLGNKVDLRDRKVKCKDIKIHRELNMSYYDISSRSNYNFEKPFIFAIRAALGDPTILFTEAPS